MNLLEKLISTLYPLKCIACRKEIAPKSELLLCDTCFDKLPHTPPGKSFEGSGHIAYVLSPFYYVPPIQQAIVRFKHGAHSYAHTWAMLMKEMVETALAHEHVDIVIGVPMHWRRKIGRGYNQAEMVAKHLANMFGLPFSDSVLLRKKKSRSQRGLSSGQRRQNVEGAFACSRPVTGATILLIDDVYTTGATAASCAKTLTAAGARRVIVATVAITRSVQTIKYRNKMQTDLIFYE